MSAFERALATILFTDIVGSTERAAALGDRAWRDLLAHHHRVIREQLARCGGVEIDTAGDGFFAAFERAGAALECAGAISREMRDLGLQVRAGIHTGECEVVDGRPQGVTVHIGARVAALADPGEVLVTGTVKDLLIGSGLSFAERGEHELKGVPGRWQLHRAVS
jgi:class 3 adenylate cyclase